MINVLLFGSGNFPIPVFRKIIENKTFTVNAIITTPSGNKEIKADDIYKLAEKFDIAIYKPENISAEADDILNKYKPDLIVVCNYGQFLGSKFLECPKYKCLNIHFSLLPKLRGACPVEMAILNGFKKTGVSVQIMEEEVDTGELIFQENLVIESKDNAKSLLVKLQKLTEKNIINLLTKWVSNSIKPWKQKGKASYCFRKDISKQKARIGWGKSAEEIDRMIRAFNPRPIAWTILMAENKDMKFKIYNADIGENLRDKGIGEVLIKSGQLFIQTKNGSIVPKEVQLEGKKVLDSTSFLNGFKSNFRFK